MSYNSRSPAVKRLMKEAQELAEPTELYYAQPLEDNLFEWHFTIRGPEDTDFQGGIYHGRILLPSEYPMKPPNILLLTPNGRFEIKRKICLSISGYHPESWRPCWSIRTALLAIIGFMPTHGGGAIGSLEFSSEERKKLAKTSSDFVCPDCGPTKSILLPQTEASFKDREEAKTLAKQIDFQSEKQKSANTAQTEAPQASASTSSPMPAAPAPAPAPAQSPIGLPAFSPWATYPWALYQPLFQAGTFPQLPAGLASVPGANQSAPLSFEQWLVQVKGYQGPNQTPSQPSSQTPNQPSSQPSSQPTAAPDPTPAPPSTVSPPPTSLSSPPPVEEPQEETPPADAHSLESPCEEEEEEEEESTVRRRDGTPEVREEEEEQRTAVSEEETPETEEWPMLSLFMICLLLVIVLLVNRYCLPYVYAFFKHDDQ